MGETTDQLREQVDQARDDATDKIMQLERQVTDAADHVKEQFDWRRQVNDHPLAAVGAAFAGGAFLGSMTSGGGQQQQHVSYPTPTGNGQSSSGSSAKAGGLGGLIRKAAKNAGLEAKIEAYAQDLFTSLGKRIGEMKDEAVAGITSQSSSRPTSSPPTTAQEPYPIVR